MYDVIPLNMLLPGQKASVDEIAGLPDQIHRLAELGLRGGAVVEMVQSGSPCIVRLADNKLCFRPDELLRVLVRRGAKK